jgi:sorting nexin-29
MLKRQKESIERNRESADARKYYQTVNWLRKGFQPRLKACKDNSGTLIEGDEKILEHWAKYFKTQSEKENNDEENEEELLQTAEPLVKEPSQEELEKAIGKLKVNKAPGEDDIIVELFKNAGQELKKRLHMLICNIWREEKMPDVWRVGLIVALFKKGDKMKCENYRRITLLNVAYKVLASIILERLKQYSEEILGEYQCGFRPQRRTTDQIFVVRQILEKFYAHDIDLHLLFIDFKKASDCINKKKLSEALVSFGIPKKINRLVKMTLEGAQAKLIVDGKMSIQFVINRGVRQGDGLSATLFNLALHRALKNLEHSNTILNRSTQICGYPDDILVIARTPPALEALCAELNTEASRMGLQINPNKTKYMRFSVVPARRSVNAATINGVTYEGVAEFIYLGTLICNDNKIEKEIQRRILAGNRTYFAAISLFKS